MTFENPPSCADAPIENGDPVATSSDKNVTVLADRNGLGFNRTSQSRSDGPTIDILQYNFFVVIDRHQRSRGQEEPYLPHFGTGVKSTFLFSQ
jgi:hypothetical protein